MPIRDLLHAPRTAWVIRPESVTAVNNHLINFVDENRTKSHIVTDFHAVTKESLRYHVTQFELDKLLAHPPDHDHDAVRDGGSHPVADRG